MLSKSLPHYGEEMEFYYLKPRPDMLADLLKFLNSSGVLAHNEKQLMTAAFFAALAMENKLDLEPKKQAWDCADKEAAQEEQV